MLSNGVSMERVNVAGISGIILGPGKEEEAPGLIWYHGWASDSESQIFRANIFASYGFHVLLIDGKNHGLRGTINYEDEKVQEEKLMATILSNIEEFPKVVEDFKKLRKLSKVFVGGHSMGAMTAGALLGAYDEVYGALCFNGMNDWGHYKSMFGANKGKEQWENNYSEYNPINDPEKFVNKPLGMFNGAEDEEVNPDFQAKFYQMVAPLYKDREAIEFMRIEGNPHMISTNMLEEGIKFLLKWK
ncbi:MAG: prolyl oligopeptidase family serine peptidase [Tissierellia bacterium]|nr:prolyl oligopeptidase family serine peptidase [Tissierellia bacterium]